MGTCGGRQCAVVQYYRNVRSIPCSASLPDALASMLPKLEPLSRLSEGTVPPGNEWLRLEKAHTDSDEDWPRRIPAPPARKSLQRAAGGST